MVQYSHCLPPTKSVMTEIVDSCSSSRPLRSSRVKLRLPKKSSLHSASNVFSSAILSCCTSFLLDSFSCEHRLNGTKISTANIPQPDRSDRHTDRQTHEKGKTVRTCQTDDIYMTSPVQPTLQQHCFRTCCTSSLLDLAL